MDKNKTYNKKQFLDTEDAHSEHYTARVSKDGYVSFVIEDGTGDRFILEGYVNTKEMAVGFARKISALTSGLVDFQDFIYQNHINRD